jgi:hypothetical protein
MPGVGSETYVSDGIYPDCYLTKYDTSGTYQWARTWGGEWDDHAFRVAGDYEGNAYVTGNYGQTVDFDPGTGVEMHTAEGARDAYLTVFESDGDFAWVNTWGGDTGQGDQNDDGYSVDVDGAGRIYVAGYYYSTVDFNPGPGIEQRISNGLSDSYVVVFDSSGGFVWVNTWGGPDGDGAYGVSVSDTGLIFVSGGFSSVVDFDPGPDVEDHISNGLSDAYLSKLLPFGGW